MSREDRERWDRRWAARSHDLGRPEPFLLRHLDLLRPGRVLDVACGAGRNALLLAGRGFSVTALDISEEGLALLRERARGKGVGIAVRRADLDDPEALSGLGRFDDLLVVRYRPDEGQWRRLLAHLVPGGRLLLCSFALEDHFRHGTRRAHCLERGALDAALRPRMRLLLRETFVQGGRFLEGSVWEKREEEGERL